MSPIQITKHATINGPPSSQEQEELFSPIPSTTTNPNKENDSEEDDDDDDDCHIMDTSLDLFASPNPDNGHHQYDPHLSSIDNHTKTSSVEVARAARYSSSSHEYDSPHSPNRIHVSYRNDTNVHSAETPYNKKRDATSSGKRGADLVRFRRDIDDNDDDGMDVLHVPSPSKFLIHAIDRLSMIDDHMNDHLMRHDNIDIFSSSQSPIVPATTTTTTKMLDDSPPMSMNQKNHPRDTSIESIEVDDGLSFGGDSNDSYDSRDHLSTRQKNPYPPPMSHHENDSLVETTMLIDNKRVHWDYDHTLIKDAPTDVRLRHGETIRYPKLTTHRTRPPMGTTTTTTSTPPTPILTQSYPDPLRLYEENVQQQLNDLYTKMIHRDRRTLRRCGAVLSMTEQQVTDVVVKLHLEHPVLEDVMEQSRHANTQTPLRGKTLILTRTKDELDMWRRAFREGSGLSIINHASMSITQRKHPTCPAKLVHTDIVLSTYDAIKSPDLAMKMDTTTGLAMTNTDRAGIDGWYTATSARPSQQNQSNDGSTINSNTVVGKALSAVHKLHWNRILLVDVLGRKGYMTKADTTARVQAVRALNANTRWIFLVPATTSNETMTTGMKSTASSHTFCDRHTLVSLASVLRHPVSEDDNVDIAKLRQEIVLDFHP